MGKLSGEGKREDAGSLEGNGGEKRRGSRIDLGRMDSWLPRVLFVVETSEGSSRQADDR